MLPGRPMAVRGNDEERIAQSNGLYEQSELLLPAPIRIKDIPGNEIRITVLMMGRGPEIRSRTYRVFHHHSVETLQKEVAQWAIEMVGKLGCTPTIPAIGVGRTHYEATCLMMDALTYREFGEESPFESYITNAINQTNTGPLGVGGSITALNTFAMIGPQRASGVRIVCLRLGCSIDPRKCTIVLK